jgi:hypothetical protein
MAVAIDVSDLLAGHSLTVKCACDETVHEVLLAIYRDLEISTTAAWKAFN